MEIVLGIIFSWQKSNIEGKKYWWNEIMRTVNWMAAEWRSIVGVPRRQCERERESSESSESRENVVSVDNLTRLTFATRLHTHTHSQRVAHRNKRCMKWNVYGVIMGKDFPLLFLASLLTHTSIVAICAGCAAATAARGAEAPYENLNLISWRNFRRRTANANTFIFICCTKTAKNSWE